MSGLGGGLSVFFGVTLLAGLEMVEMLIILILRLMAFFFGCWKMEKEEKENTATRDIKCN